MLLDQPIAVEIFHRGEFCVTEDSPAPLLRHRSRAIAWESSDDELDSNRLVVDPSAFRRGIACTLVGEALDRAGTRTVVVATGRDNKPARALYERLGFTWVEDVEVIPQLWITRYRRPCPIA